jgi:hypothetical protein
MEKVIFISPHLDDAVFSCAGLIQNLVQKSHDVEILTLFSQSDLSQQTLYLTRKEEDKKASQILGAHIQHLNFLDAPFRSDNPKMVFQSLDSEKQTLALVTKKLKEIFSDNSSALFYAPLGVGWHKDHLIAFEAALSSIPHDRLRFYEEAPYSLIRHQTQLRLKGMDNAIFEEFSASFFKATYVKKFLSHWSQEFLIKMFSSYSHLKIPVNVELFKELSFEGEDLKKIDAAKKQYESQSAFYDPPEETFLKEKYFKIII